MLMQMIWNDSVQAYRTVPWKVIGALDDIRLTQMSLSTPNKLFALTSSKGGSSLFYGDIVRSKRGQMHDLFFSGLRPRQFPGYPALPHDENTVGQG